MGLWTHMGHGMTLIPVAPVFSLHRSEPDLNCGAFNGSTSLLLLLTVLFFSASGRANVTFTIDIIFVASEASPFCFDTPSRALLDRAVPLCGFADLVPSCQRVATPPASPTSDSFSEQLDLELHLCCPTADPPHRSVATSLSHLSLCAAPCHPRPPPAISTLRGSETCRPLALQPQAPLSALRQRSMPGTPRAALGIYQSLSSIVPRMAHVIIA